MTTGGTAWLLTARNRHGPPRGGNFKEILQTRSNISAKLCGGCGVSSTYTHLHSFSGVGGVVGRFTYEGSVLRGDQGDGSLIKYTRLPLPLALSLPLRSLLGLAPSSQPQPL